MKKKLYSLFITTGTYKSFIERICKLANDKTSSYVCVANVHMVMEAHRSESFSRIVNDADMVTPDGMPLVTSLKKLYGVQQDRVAGMDLLPDLMNQAERLSIPVYFYGGTEEILIRTREYISEKFPGIIFAGSYSPPFRPLTSEESQAIADQIGESGAQLVFVVLGCPKQEIWMGSMKGKINACMVGIGGALPVLIGMQKRAPVWMQRRSLEWLFRLGQEPKRLFKRYAVTNIAYSWLMFKTLLKKKTRDLDNLVK
jgi:N-acetylglucosaminyldiphosphoundecaprenol N-acetyl-beta-D-mannosaminyltransferase